MINSILDHYDIAVTMHYVKLTPDAESDTV